MKKSSKILILVFALIFLAVMGGVGYKYYLSRSRSSATKDVPATSEKVAPPRDFKVAFFGDQGLTDDSRRVLELVKSEKSGMIFQLGDYDYANEPDEWEAMTDGILGSDFTILGVIGNHDLNAWDVYQEKLQKRAEKIGAKCEGDLGVKSVCTYKGLRFVMSGIGTTGDDQEEFIKKSLSEDDDYVWEICAWHKNQRLMQAGGKPDEVGWGAYDICREEGALVATGHEHSYSRTHLLSDFENQTVASKENILEVAKGKVFAFVSGMGGHSIRPQADDVPKQDWWASVYTQTQNAKPGALFCSFNPGGEREKAECYFKDVDGKVVDKFVIIKKN